jgi:site-specific DNA-cytosine methylase
MSGIELTNSDLWEDGLPTEPLEHRKFKQMTLKGIDEHFIYAPLVEVVDLFCGGGGFTEGAIRAGAKVVLAVDCWEPALEVHHANHPDVPTENLMLGGSIVETAIFIRKRLSPGAHFHLHGSPPCQKLSNASSGDPEEGMVLVNWFIDLVRYMKPDSWSMENVVPVGKKIDKHRPNTPYVKLNSADFGVPQTRNRIFAGEGWKATPTHAKEEWVSVLEALPHLEEELEGTRIVSRRRKAGEEPQSYDPLDPAHTITQVRHVIEYKLEALGANQKRHQDRSITEPSKTICGSGNQVGARIFAHINTSGNGSSMSRRALSVDSHIDEPMKTLCNNSPTIRLVGEMPQAIKIRSLTLHETAVIQGFSPNMEIPYKRKKDAWTILGNAVCPPVAEAIIKGLIL